MKYVGLYELKETRRWTATVDYVQADILDVFPAISVDSIRNSSGHRAQGHEQIIQVHYASNGS